MKKILSLALVSLMVISVLCTCGGSTEVAASESAEQNVEITKDDGQEDYSFLDEMSVPELEALDKEIHIRLENKENTNDEEDSLNVGDIVITYSDSESEIMTIKEYVNLMSNNQAKFKKLNEGATLTIIGYAQEVKNPITVNGKKFLMGYVYLTSDKSPWEDKGFAMNGIYVDPLSNEAFADIDLNTIVTFSGKYAGYINSTPVVSAVTELVVLDE